MATAILSKPPTDAMERPNIYLRVDRDTISNRSVSRYLTNAIVESITYYTDENFSTAQIRLPSARFGNHVTFGSRIMIYIDNQANKVFDGHIVKETSTLNSGEDSLTVVAYGPKWLLNSQTVIGTYDAKWNSTVFSDANQITGIKQVDAVEIVNFAKESEIPIYLGGERETITTTNNIFVTFKRSKTKDWNNKSQRTVFNENGIPDRTYKVFSQDGKKIPLFDKRSPHQGKMKVEDDNGNLIDNPYYPKFWRYGDIIAYLIYFHNGKEDIRYEDGAYDIRFLERDYDLLNTLPEPKNLDLNNTPLINAIGQIFRNIGPRFSFDVEIVGNGDNRYYRLIVLDNKNPADREVRIASSTFIHGQSRLNASGITISHDASNVITSLKGLGRKIEFEMTIKLEPAWDWKEVKALFPNIDQSEVNEIFYLRHILKDNFEVASTTSTIGTAKSISDGFTYLQVYNKMRDFFDNRMFKIFKLPSDIAAYKNTLGTDTKFVFQTLDEFFVSNEDNAYREVRPPETPLRYTDFTSGIPDSKSSKYNAPFVMAWDACLGIFEIAQHNLAYDYHTAGDGDTNHEAAFDAGSVKNVNVGNSLSGAQLMFSVDKNIITFSDFMYNSSRSDDNAIKATYASYSADKAIKKISPTKDDVVSGAIFTINSKEVYMTAVIDTDIRLTPEVATTFQDFEDAGITVNRYLENNDYRVVIRNHAILLNLIAKYNKGNDGNYTPSEKSINRAGFADRDTNEGQKRLRIQVNSGLLKGKLEDFTDPIDGDGNVTKAFINDYDDLLDHLQGRLGVKSKVSENISVTLDKFDISYRLGERIRDVINSRAYGAGFYANNAIITGITLNCEGQFVTTLTANNIQVE